MSPLTPKYQISDSEVFGNSHHGLRPSWLQCSENFFRGLQSSKKVFEHFCDCMAKMLPPLPHSMLTNANGFSKSPKCTNIDLGGKGDWGLLGYVSFNSQISNIWFRGLWKFSPWFETFVAPVFGKLFSRIVWVECKIFHIDSVFLS